MLVKLGIPAILSVSGGWPIWEARLCLMVVPQPCTDGCILYSARTVITSNGPGAPPWAGGCDNPALAEVGFTQQPARCELDAVASVFLQS